MVEGHERTLQSQFQTLRRQRIKAIEEERGSSLVVYYAVRSLDHPDAKRLYNMLSSLGEPPARLDLMVVSPGGFIDPAYKMALLCREFCTDKFSVLVPYYAKSAATLLALGADEIVMGPSSELGPIDPQVRLTPEAGRRTIPALSLSDAIRFIQRTLDEHPEQAALFATMLGGIDIRTLGEYERVIEGSKQYATELLKRMFKGDGGKAENVANDLVKEYKIHGFVIDRRRARENLHLNVVDPPGKLWQNMWQLSELYETLIEQSRSVDRMICKVFESRVLGPYYVWFPTEQAGEMTDEGGPET
jgi:hypothetical protein